MIMGRQHASLGDPRLLRSCRLASLNQVVRETRDEILSIVDTDAFPPVESRWTQGDRG